MMLSGGAYAIPAAEAFYTPQDVLCASGGDVIQIKRKHVPPGYRTGFTAVSFQRAGDIPADVLQIILEDFL